MDSYLTFTLETNRYGIRIGAIEKVTHAVAVTHLPAAPPSLLGTINYHGTYIPVINVRKKFGIPFKPVELKDKLIIIKNSNGSFALIADATGDTVEVSPSLVSPADFVWKGLSYVQGLFKSENGAIILIEDENLLREDDLSFINSTLYGQNSGGDTA